jgi:hypothetical protein
VELLFSSSNVNDDAAPVVVAKRGDCTTPPT